MRATSAAALYIIQEHILRLSFSQNNTEKNDQLYKYYWPIACDEFFRVTFSNAENDLSNIVDLILRFSIDAIHDSDNQKLRIQKDCLKIFLKKLTTRQVEIIGEELLEAILSDQQHRKNDLPLWKFYLLFWLLEKNQNYGVLSDTDFGEKTQLTITTVYMKAFNDNIDSEAVVFGPCNFFDTLPWKRFDNAKAIDLILKIVPKPAEWILKLSSESNKNYYANQNLLRSYFQLLLCIFQPKEKKQENNKILNKIIRLIESVGFLESTDNCHYAVLFSNRKITHDYQLWRRFTHYIDTLNDETFSRVVGLVEEKMPINRLLEIYKQTKRQKRAKEIEKFIDKKIFHDFCIEGLSALEEAFILAFNTRQLDLASNLLTTALERLEEPFFINTKEFFFRELKDKWKVYKYKVDLIDLFRKDDFSINDKISVAWNIDNPFHGNKHSIERYRHNDCDRFRRFLIATELIDTKPLTSYNYLNQLYKEDSKILYAGQRFVAKIQCLDLEQANNNEYQIALTEWLESKGATEIAEIDVAFLYKQLICYLKLKKHNEIEKVWVKCSSIQKNDLHIATLYCKSLKEQGEHHKALKIFEKIEDFHQQDISEEKAKKLLNDLKELVFKDQTRSSVMAITKKAAVELQSTEQLIRYYHEIKSKSLSELIEIIEGKKVKKEDFLYRHSLKISKELIFRKRNLQIHQKKAAIKDSHRITKEDLINDWFVSLFDHRFYGINLSCRDQKRGGESETKRGVGEIDGFIYHHNDRIAIMEAFRLFSNNNKVITTHLDKLSNYNPEYCSPVIILAYCHVSDFPSLCSNYESDLKNRQYNGFKRADKNNHQVEVVNDDPHLKAFKEIRYRDNTEICFFHFMMDFKFG